jgi:lysophospholipase L1-like esterase
MTNKPCTYYPVFFKRLSSLHHSSSIVFLLGVMLFSFSLLGYATSDLSNIWVGTWSTAPQLVEPGNMPPSPGLNNNTLRQVIRVSIGGDSLRIRFSNVFSNSTVTMKAVKIAVSTGGSTIDASTMKELKFNGSSDVSMNPGVTITSDPISFNLKPRMDISITIYFGQTASSITGHPGSRTTSWLLTGDKTSSIDFAGSVPTDHWYFINGIDVKAPESASAIAILGNSITDGRGSDTNRQNRWTDILSERLLKNSGTSQVAVLNLGIGGNCVLSGGLGPTGVNRYERDILQQAGVRFAIVFIGVNDIGRVRSSADATLTANSLISTFKVWIQNAHAKNVKIYGATILPFNGNSYYNQYSDLCRNQVNTWIRTKGNYDGLIDFDRSLRSKSDTTRLVSTYQCDGLHPTAEEYKKMGQSIDLKLFE